MKVKELIQKILEFTNTFSESDLVKLDKSELERIYDYSIVNPEEFEGENMLIGDSEDEEYDDDGDYDEEEYEEIEIDISKLSIADQRLYARTGRISQSVINRYTRFNEESTED